MKPIIADRKSLFKWLMPLAAGFIFVLVSFRFYKALHPNYPVHIVQMSKEMRMSPQETKDADDMFYELANGKTPTEAQWQTVRRMVESGNVAQQRRALLMLNWFPKPQQRQAAAQYAESLVSSPDSHIKASSVSVLAHLHDSRWKALALQNRNSPDPIVRQSATALLDRQDRFK